MNQIKITISGVTMTGKTVLSHWLAKELETLGHKVILKDESNYNIKSEWSPHERFEKFEPAEFTIQPKITK